jgi:hypothetical protein
MYALNLQQKSGQKIKPTGWFFGFKLHLGINHQGEIISFCLTRGNTVDQKPVELLSQKL